MPRPSSTRSDVLGLSTSLLCLVHCLALPVLVSFSALVTPAGFHQLDWLFLTVALVAAVGTTRRSHDAGVRSLLWIGFALFASGLLLEQTGLLVLPYSLGHVVGSLLMLTGHVRSLRVGTCTVAGHGH